MPRNRHRQERLRIEPLCLRNIAARKNYLFAGSDRGAERATATCSLSGTAKLNGLDREGKLTLRTYKAGQKLPHERRSARQR